MWFTAWALMLCISLAVANVEKTIFIAPPSDIAQPPAVHGVNESNLETLSPMNPSIRTSIDAVFPSENASRGTRTWLFLDGLRPGQRYEVRICWLATQPTEFSLHAYTLSEVLGSPSLLSSLTTASAKDKRQDDLPEQLSYTDSNATGTTSSLFLLIEAAADYFTLDEALMKSVPPVQVDIILDPFLFNILPESLLSTAGYLVVVATMGWWLSGLIWSIVKGIARTSQAPHAKEAVSVEKKKD